MTRPVTVDLELSHLSEENRWEVSNTEEYIKTLEVEVGRLRETEKKLREITHSLKDDNASYFSRNLELEQERDQLRERLNEKYKPPKGVIGYMQKDQLFAFIENGSQHDLVGLDSPDCWAEEAPYQNLVAVCAIESVAQHDAEVIRAAMDTARDACDGYGTDSAMEYDAALCRHIDQLLEEAKENNDER